MNPHYYIMKNKKILRLEENETFSSLSESIRGRILIPDDIISLDQDQANWRVVIFRDEILDLDEYIHWLQCPEAMIDDHYEYENDFIAN
jgi:hypothetical protein